MLVRVIYRNSPAYKMVRKQRHAGDKLAFIETFAETHHTPETPDGVAVDYEIDGDDLAKLVRQAISAELGLAGMTCSIEVVNFETKRPEERS